MKKFIFTLDKVLDYKEQVENNLRNEYAQIALRVRQQEKRIEDLNAEAAKCRSELEQKKQAGFTVNLMVTYDAYLERLRKQIEHEEAVLRELQKQAEKKRQEVVEAKVETSSFEKLKEKKRAEYDKEVQKQDEQFIEEFVSNTTSAGNAMRSMGKAV